MNKEFTRGVLSKKLKELGLPCTNPTLDSYEAKGIIDGPDAGWADYGTRKHRRYTEAGMNKIIQQVKKHESDKRAKGV